MLTFVSNQFLSSYHILSLGQFFIYNTSFGLYIKLDAIIFELNKNLKEIMVKIAPKFLGEHASFQKYVLKQLLGHNFSLLGKGGGNNC